MKKTEVAKRRTVRLQTNADARRFLARVVNATWQGRLSTDEGRALCYMVGVLAKINDAAIEDRLAAMESQLEKITKEADHEHDEETD